MLAVEDILSELGGDHDVNEQGLPPGFRFHPTDEELITFYLASKVFSGNFCGVEIAEVDLNRCEPWELPDMAKMGEREWYFFSLRDRKYPTGLRTNRATGAGYWKATGKDREVYSASNGALLGMKKTLVFYKGRAPRGEKTKWVMHEYRLDGDFSYRQYSCKEEWVICRIFHKIMEKRNHVLQGQSYLLKTSSPTIISELPPLPEAPKTTLLEPQTQNSSIQDLQDPFLNRHQERDLRSLMDTVVSQCNLLPAANGGLFQVQPSAAAPNPITTSIANQEVATMDQLNKSSPSSSVLCRSLLSHQECNNLRKELAIANAVSKQCKTEASFSPLCQPYDPINYTRWPDKINSQQSFYQHPLIFGMDYDIMGSLPSAANAERRPTSSFSINPGQVHLSCFP